MDGAAITRARSGVGPPAGTGCSIARTDASTALRDAQGRKIQNRKAYLAWRLFAFSGQQFIWLAMGLLLRHMLLNE